MNIFSPPTTASYALLKGHAKPRRYPPPLPKTGSHETQIVLYSGGPLIERSQGKNRVLGVASWVHHSGANAGLCYYGGVYLRGVRTGDARDDRPALAWVDPCAGLDVVGRWPLPVQLMRAPIR